MAYADYAFYTDIYKGDMPESKFERYAERATEYLDYITQNKAQSIMASVPAPLEDGGVTVLSPVVTAIKKAVCAVADTKNFIDCGGATSSLSFNADGYSETRMFALGTSNIKNEDEQLYSAAQGLRTYGLLSRVGKLC